MCHESSYPILLSFWRRKKVGHSGCFRRTNMCHESSYPLLAMILHHYIYSSTPPQSALHLNCHLNYFHPTSDYFQLEDNYNEPLPLFLILTSICSVLICSPPRIFLSLHLPYSHFFSSEPHGLPPTPTKLHEKWSTTSADENSRSTVNDSDTLNLYPSLYTILVSTITDDHQDAGSTLTHSTTLVRRSTFLQLQELKEAVTFISKLINKEAELVGPGRM